MKKRIAIGHPCVLWGGSEATCLWTIQALKEHYDVTLVTTLDVDLASLNKYYGTSIQPDELTVRIAPVPFFMKNNARIAALRGAFFGRFTRAIGHEYDVCISTYNISDWGRPGIHLIADFSWDKEISNKLDPLPLDGSRWIHQDSIIRRMYLAFCNLMKGKTNHLSDFFKGHETIISNSIWSAEIIKQKYSYKCDCNIYPPVQAGFKKVAWENKLFRFVSIGRIAREKRVELQIDILEQVRELGHNIHFSLIGDIGEEPYQQMIKELCVDKNWITLEGHKCGTDKESLLAESKFAIHTRPHEAFGITVAELVRAGCVPFVPDTGGQTEIVPIRELQFSSVSEAVQKIDFILKDEEMQQRILHQLGGKEDLFAVDNFCTQIRQIVNDMV